jgi:Na+:H+ antiporter, NhaA family
VVALAWANSPWRASYDSWWHTEAVLRIGTWRLAEDLRHWVNDGLMTLFFFVVGLEIKRELVDGQLRSARAAALPVVAALGGMVTPALLYAAVNLGGDGAGGWGIPMATDIAFALGVVALLGRAVPSSLKVFLLTLAIVDDIGAIVVIAVFYTDDLAATALLAAAVLLLVVLVMRRLRVSYVPLYALVGAGVWLATFQSGVHATLAGVVLGLLTPAVVADRLEHAIHPWTSYVVVPVFALANAGVWLGGDALSDAVGSPVAAGIVLGLLVGKTVGITAFTWVATRLRLADLPHDVRWSQLVAVAAVAGIGFTVSLFISGLAFDAPALDAEAKVGILFASVVAAVGGGAALWVAARRTG